MKMMMPNFQTDPMLAGQLEQGRTLPAHWYSDPAVFEAEKQRIFHRSWQYVGDIGQVNEPGDFITATIGDLPILVVHDNEGAIRAFANVCRHRGSEVVLECAGNRKTLQCHYHGWTYNLDGSLRNAPRSNEQASFAKENLSLKSFALQAWGPMIFVNPDPVAPPFDKVTAELPAVFERGQVDLGRLRMRRHDVYEIAANWKSIIENFNECYHCPVAHPAFSKLIDVDNYKVETDHEYFSTYYGPIRQSRENGVTYATLWPTVMFALSSKPMAMQVLCVIPIDAQHSRETIDYYFTDDISENEMREYVELSDLVQREDIVLVESVQRGLRSGAVAQGNLMLSRERGIQHFQKLVYRFLSVKD
jgi:choline monooxygenase